MFQVAKLLKALPSIGKESKWFYVGAVLGVYIFSILLVYLQPLDAQGYQYYDDDLYFSNAYNMTEGVEGGWMGPFDDRVISKAPLFSVFLAGTHIIGIPLRIGELLLFVFLPFLFKRAIAPICRIDRISMIGVTVLLVAMPIAGFGYRLSRSSFYGGLVVLFLILLVGCVSRAWKSERGASAWAVVVGLVFGCAGVTREEASWLLVPLLLGMGFFAFQYFRNKRVLQLLITLLLAGIAYLVPVSSISALNYASYGVYSPSLRQNKEFREFFSLLVSLGAEQRREPRYKFVTLSTELRKSLYVHSESFRELEPFLEGKVLDDLAKHKGHMLLNGWEPGEREFFVSNFEFALTRAIVLSGKKTGASFVEFCGRASREVEAAVASGHFTKGISLLPMLPSPEWSDSGDIVSATFRSLKLLFSGQGQDRSNLLRTRSPTDKETGWSAYLRSWPLPSDIGANGFQSRIGVFNSWIAKPYQFIYPIVSILGLLGIVACFRAKDDRWKVYLFLYLLGLLSIVAFSLVMGIADTVAWPILNNPRSYNRLGYFPMHVFVVLAFVFFYEGLKRLRKTREDSGLGETVEES